MKLNDILIEDEVPAVADGDIMTVTQNSSGDPIRMSDGDDGLDLEVKCCGDWTDVDEDGAECPACGTEYDAVAERLPAPDEDIVEAVAPQSKNEKLRKQYDKNEDINAHRENVVLLTKHFGTPEEHQTAKDYVKERDRIGHASQEAIDFGYEMNKKYYPKLMEAEDHEAHAAIVKKFQEARSKKDAEDAFAAERKYHEEHGYVSNAERKDIAKAKHKMAGSVGHQVYLGALRMNESVMSDDDDDITEGQPGRHGPSNYTYVGIHQKSGLHMFKDEDGKEELFAARGDRPAGWHLTKGDTHYEFVRSRGVNEGAVGRGLPFDNVDGKGNEAHKKLIAVMNSVKTKGQAMTALRMRNNWRNTYGIGLTAHQVERGEAEEKMAKRTGFKSAKHMQAEFNGKEFDREYPTNPAYLKAKIKPMTEAEGSLGYIAMFCGKQLEIRDATSLYDAKLKAIERLKVPKSKQGLLAVMLAEKDGKPVVHVATESVLNEDKWSADVTADAKHHPKAGLYASGSAEDIAKSETSQQINFYLQRAGSNLSAERKATIKRALALAEKK